MTRQQPGERRTPLPDIPCLLRTDFLAGPLAASAAPEEAATISEIPAGAVAQRGGLSTVPEDHRDAPDDRRQPDCGDQDGRDHVPGVVRFERRLRPYDGEEQTRERQRQAQDNKHEREHARPEPLQHAYHAVAISVSFYPLPGRVASPAWKRRIAAGIGVLSD